MTDQSLDVSKIYPFPMRQIADNNICDKIDSLWFYNKKFIILTGPPGVGKTRAAEDYIYKKIETLSPSISSIETARITNLFPDFRSKVYLDSEISEKLREKAIKFVWDLAVLHPQYSYEDLIRGYKVFTFESSSTLKVRQGILGFISRVVNELEQLNGERSESHGVLVLDEINRAPIGQLFGEAIYALDRRGIEATTPYDLEGYGCNLTIPKGLLILGTMNSIDRATSGFDYALRRRFSNIMVTPNINAVKDAWSILDSEKANIGPKLFELVKSLIIDSENIGTIPKDELVLGHAYFIPPDNLRADEESMIKWLISSYMYQILPTLLDYVEQGLLEFSQPSLTGIPMGDVLEGKMDLYQVDATEIESEFLRFLNVEP